MKSVQTLSGAVNCLEKCEELMLAAKTCEKLVNLLCINSYSDNEIIAKVEIERNISYVCLCIDLIILPRLIKQLHFIRDFIMLIMLYNFCSQLPPIYSVWKMWPWLKIFLIKQ